MLSKMLMQDSFEQPTMKASQKCPPVIFLLSSCIHSGHFLHFLRGTRHYYPGKILKLECFKCGRVKTSLKNLRFPRAGGLNPFNHCLLYLQALHKPATPCDDVIIVVITFGVECTSCIASIQSLP